MKGIKLSAHINYLHCTDHGIMTLDRGEGYTPSAVSIETQDDFKFWYTQFKKQEDAMTAAVSLDSFVA